MSETFGGYPLEAVREIAWSVEPIRFQFPQAVARDVLRLMAERDAAQAEAEDLAEKYLEMCAAASDEEARAERAEADAAEGRRLVGAYQSLIDDEWLPDSQKVNAARFDMLRWVAVLFVDGRAVDPPDEGGL